MKSLPPYCAMPEADAALLLPDWSWRKGPHPHPMKSQLCYYLTDLDLIGDYST